LQAAFTLTFVVVVAVVDTFVVVVAVVVAVVDTCSVLQGTSRMPQDTGHLDNRLSSPACVYFQSSTALEQTNTSLLQVEHGNPFSSLNSGSSEQATSFELVALVVVVVVVVVVLVVDVVADVVATVVVVAVTSLVVVVVTDVVAVVVVDVVVVVGGGGPAVFLQSHLDPPTS
jgi:hypothetical protein